MFNATYKTYTTIDCLWDTIHGTVVRYDKDIAHDIINQGYYERRTNVMSRYHPDIDDEEFYKLWLARDYETFKLSHTNNLFNMLRMHGEESKILPKNHPYKKQLHLFLNTYPYNLSNKFVKELLTLLKEELVVDKIFRVHFPHYELSTKWIKENRVDRFIITDFATFNNMNFTTGDVQQGIPFVRCVAPFVYANAFADRETYDKMPIPTIAKMYQDAFRYCLDVEILPLFDYSICPP